MLTQSACCTSTPAPSHPPPVSFSVSEWSREPSFATTAQHHRCTLPDDALSTKCAAGGSRPNRSRCFFPADALSCVCSDCILNCSPASIRNPDSQVRHAPQPEPALVRHPPATASSPGTGPVSHQHETMPVNTWCPSGFHLLIRLTRPFRPCSHAMAGHKRSYRFIPAPLDQPAGRRQTGCMPR